MRAGSQPVRATVREPLGWRSWHGVQACGVRHAQSVRAAPPHRHARCGCNGQCGRQRGCAVREHSRTTYGCPCQGAQAHRCGSDACKGELRRILPLTCRHSMCSRLVYCTDGCSAPPCTLLWCWRRPARARPTRCSFRRTQPLPPARASHTPPSRARHSPPRTHTGRTFAAVRTNARRTDPSQVRGIRTSRAVVLAAGRAHRHCARRGRDRKLRPRSHGRHCNHPSAAAQAVCPLPLTPV